MAARAAELGDVGESSPEHWEKPLGTPDVHVALAALAPDAGAARARSPSGRAARTRSSRGVEVIWRQDCYQLPTGRTSFGFKDGIGQPAVEGSGTPPRNPARAADQGGRVHPRLPRRDRRRCRRCRRPDVLGRNGTYVVFRKLHTRVAAYRQYLRERAANREEEALLGAKMVGPLAERRAARARPGRGRPRARRRPGAQQRLPLRRRPARASSARRAPTPDGPTPATPSTHEMQRRRPAAPHDPPRHQLRPDAARRACSRTTARTGASSSSSPARTSTGSSSSSRPSGSTTASSSARPPRRTPWSGPTTGPAPSPSRSGPSGAGCTDLPPFVVTRGGEYCFAPGLRALRWLADLDT